MRLKLNKGVEKYILRESIKNINLPSIIRKRQKLGAGGTVTAPKATIEFNKFCQKLTKTRKPSKYDKYFQSDEKKVCFDLLNYIFIENEGCKSKNLSVNDLY